MCDLEKIKNISRNRSGNDVSILDSSSHNNVGQHGSQDRMCFVVCIPFLYSMKKCKYYVHELVIKSYSSISNQLNVHVVVLL